MKALKFNGSFTGPVENFRAFFVSVRSESPCCQKADSGNLYEDKGCTYFRQKCLSREDGEMEPIQLIYKRKAFFRIVAKDVLFTNIW